MAGLWCASLGFSRGAAGRRGRRGRCETLPYYHAFSGKVPGPVTELAAGADALGAGARWARVLFANSGSEANDTAFKLVRYYNNARGRPTKKKIIARPWATTASPWRPHRCRGWPMMHRHFDLPLPGVLRVGCAAPLPPTACPARASSAVRRAPGARARADLIQREGADTIAAFIAEPVQGAGGVIIPPAGYFRAGAGDPEAARHPVHRRRGHHRLRPPRPAVRLARVRPQARHDHGRQDADLGLRADVGAVRQRGDLPGGRRRQRRGRHLRPRLHRTAAIRSPARWRWKRCASTKSDDVIGHVQRVAPRLQAGPAVASPATRSSATCAASA